MRPNPAVNTDARRRGFAPAAVGLVVVTGLLTRYLVAVVQDLRTTHTITTVLDEQLAREVPTVERLRGFAARSDALVRRAPEMTRRVLTASTAGFVCVSMCFSLRSPRDSPSARRHCNARRWPRGGGKRERRRSIVAGRWQRQICRPCYEVVR